MRPSKLTPVSDIWGAWRARGMAYARRVRAWWQPLWQRHAGWWRAASRAARTQLWRQRAAILRGTAGLLGVVLIALLLRWGGVDNSLTRLMLTLGFDTERAQMVAAVLAALLTATIGGAILVRRGWACWGSLAFFVVAYLIPFAAQTTQRITGPSGLPEALVPAALIRVLAGLLALGGLGAAAGAVLGEAFGRQVVLPLVVGMVRLAGRLRGRPAPGAGWLTAHSLGTLALGGLVVLALGASAATVSDLLTFGPSADLYQQVRPMAQGGTVQHGSYSSPALGGIARHYVIYLPPGYAGTETRRYPVLYLLHGSPGGPRDWFFGGQAAQTADALIAAGAIHALIMVSPDGSGPLYPDSEWADSWDHRQLVGTSIAVDLVRSIDLHYRTRADAADRAIGGVSEGGFGAVNLALHHADVFGSVFSLGGYFTAHAGPIFGGAAQNTAYRLDNSPADFAVTPTGLAAAQRTQWVIGVATSDQPYYDDGTRFYHELSGLSGIHVRMIVAHGGHAWRVWAGQLGQVLRILASSKESI